MKINPKFLSKRNNKKTVRNKRCTPAWKEISKFDTLIGLSSAVMPAANVTNSKFAIFDPITLPTDISGEPLITASIETTS